ncbi:MAG: hypothetical protein MK135_17275, partial [Polyangiaceae bacterium]|nr:hypothetical protein [Polyangiaceae bacterium]
TKELLSTISGPGDSLGLVTAVGSRASDLPWIFAVENRGTATIRLSALPQLLSFRVIPPADSASSESSSAKEGILCEKARPTSISTKAELDLPPGGILSFPFDPRAWCDDPAILTQGSRIESFYGFPVKTKKRWKRGKLITEDLPPSAPWAASQLTEDGALNQDDLDSHLLSLDIEAFTLDSTYPLEQLLPLPASSFSSPSAPAAQNDAEDSLSSAKTKTEKQSGSAPHSRKKKGLHISVENLGLTSRPLARTITVTFKNYGPKTESIMLRRENISYEFQGPQGHISCGMPPQGAPARPSSYVSLKPGQTRSLTTRMAEACATGSFTTPGRYSINARYEVPADEERRVPEVLITSDRTATMTLRGKKGAEQMRLYLPESESE